MTTKIKAVVLGHSGFIGAAIMGFLKDLKVNTIGLSTKDVDLTSVDCLEKLKPLMDKNTVVIFCSALMPGRGGNTQVGFRSNVSMVINSLPAFAGIKKLVFLGTTGIYGDASFTGVVTEETVIKPTMLYTWAKLIGEEACQAFSQDTKTPLLVLRPTIVYGPGNCHQNYNPTAFVIQAFRDGKITLWGDGDDKRDFVFVRDLAEIVGLLSVDDARGAYNVGSGSTHSFNDVAKKVSGLFKDIKVEYQPRRQPVSQHYYNIRKLKSVPVLSDFQFTSLSEGLLATVIYFCEKGADNGRD